MAVVVRQGCGGGGRLGVGQRQLGPSAGGSGEVGRCGDRGRAKAARLGGGDEEGQRQLVQAGGGEEQR